MVKMYNKVCKFCNKSFLHKDNRQKFCSRKCYLELNIVPLKNKICKFCGNKFLGNKEHRNVKFCSRSCAIKNNWKNGSYPKEIQKIMGINGGIKRQGKNRKERIKKICTICNKEFSHVPNYARQVDCCSYKCAARSRITEEFRKKISAFAQRIPLNEWTKFTSFEPYPSNFNREFKLKIRQRDGFMCIKCGMREEDAKIIFNKGLTTHHINYDKKLTIPENCCALCLRCHVETNHNRKHWTKFFQSLLSERYGYKYSENLEPILVI
jgi:hypothetical protein